MVHHYGESVAGRLAISVDPIIRCKKSFWFHPSNRELFYLRPQEAALVSSADADLLKGDAGFEREMAINLNRNE